MLTFTTQKTKKVDCGVKKSRPGAGNTGTACRLLRPTVGKRRSGELLTCLGRLFAAQRLRRFGRYFRRRPNRVLGQEKTSFRKRVLSILRTSEKSIPSHFAAVNKLNRQGGDDIAGKMDRRPDREDAQQQGHIRRSGG